MGKCFTWIQTCLLIYFTCPVCIVLAFLSSSGGQDIPIECSYFSSFQDAVETVKRMQQQQQYLHLQVGCNFAKEILHLPLDPEETEYNKALPFIGSNAVNLHNLQKDLLTIHNYRHDKCIRLILHHLSLYLGIQKFDVCVQFKTEMSGYFSTDHVSCLSTAICTQCNSGDCINSTNATLCTNGERFCMTSVLQSKAERKVIRKCSDEPECRLNHVGLQDCLLVDEGPLGFAYDCHFCCVGFNCNKGPSLVPPPHTHYNKTM